MPEFFSREELLNGLPARRAGTILFAIESRTAYLVAQSRQAAARFVTEKTAEEREHAFLKALARGRDLPIQPTIQDLERYAPEWASLVPDNPGVQAAIVHMLGEKYTFTYQSVPSLRQALGLDDEAVEEAYQRNYDQPLQKIFALQITPRERLRWIWSGLAQWLEDLPPFWTAFALTGTEIVGASILALPIALAGVGPIAGVVLLLVLGLVNILTIASIVEAIIRNGNMRYGSSYLGRLVGDYLGNVGTFILASVLLVDTFLLLIAFYIGVATTLADATGISPMLWTALLFIVGVYCLRRESLDVTVASALIVGAINVSLIIILSLLALPYVRIENLQHMNVPFINGQALDVSILGLIFGVVLSSFFGHTSAANAAKVVLRRDPSGRALIGGNVAALVVVIGLYSLWVVAINGSIKPEVLAGASGTALTPLAKVVGPVVFILGSIFVILAMGMITIHSSLALFNQVREWLPGPPQPNASRGQSSVNVVLWVRAILSSQHGRFWIGIAPIGLVFLWTEWLLLNGQESFIGPIAFLGVITLPLLGGIFPILMLTASRRKGDYVPGVVWRFLGHPIVVVGIYLIFLTSILAHGLVIWQDSIQRGAAMVMSGVILVMTFAVIRRGAFTPRTVVELRVDQTTSTQAVFGVTSKGNPLPSRVRLVYCDDEQIIQAATGEVSAFTELHSAIFELPSKSARELKVWLHQLTPEGVSKSLPAMVEVNQSHEKQTLDLKLSNGQVVLPLNDEACRLEISFADESMSDLLTSL